MSLRELIPSRKLFWVALNLILVAFAIIIWKILILGLPVLPERHMITVSAEGRAVVSPDIARVSFSVVTEGENPETVQEENTKKMNKALAFVKDQDINEKDIKTANYNLSPKYDYSNRLLYPRPTGVIIGYTLSQTVQIKVRDLEKVAPLLGGLPSRGINRIENVSFDIDDPDQFLEEAREEAFDKARKKAKAMAKENGVSIKRVVTFSESGDGNYPGPYARAEVFSLDAVGGVVAPQIEPGSQDVTVRVSVTYEIR